MLRLYIMLALLVPLFIAVIVIRIQHHRIQMLSSELSMIRNESVLREKRYKDAKVIADKNTIESQKAVDKILKEKVPENCEQAIQWGIEQAKNF